jgi:hypothetical protein
MSRIVDPDLSPAEHASHATMYSHAIVEAYPIFPPWHETGIACSCTLGSWISSYAAFGEAAEMRADGTNLEMSAHRPSPSHQPCEPVIRSSGVLVAYSAVSILHKRFTVNVDPVEAASSNIEPSNPLLWS